MIQYIKLPVQFDAKRMLNEIENLTSVWNPHFNKYDYEGDWSGLALRAPGGVASSLFAECLNIGDGFENTPLLAQCTYIQEVLSAIECNQTAVRLLKLAPNTVIREHRDVGLNYEQGEVRLHIPICTNELVDFYLDGHRLSMRAGECWYINANLPHRLANRSQEDRIHLVVDCIVNDWLKQQFSRNDLPVKSEKDTSDTDIQLQRTVIAELRRSDDPKLLLLADKMDLEINRVSRDNILSAILNFIESIGIQVISQCLEGDTFLPGISIEAGTLVIDKEKLLHPGDLLHEAGHIAVIPLAERSTLNAKSIGERRDHAAEEMMAIAWSYAACLHLNIDPKVVFHDDGYKGGGESILSSMKSPMPLGSPMLAYVGMTFCVNPSTPSGADLFPVMSRWTRA